MSARKDGQIISVLTAREAGARRIEIARSHGLSVRRVNEIIHDYCLVEGKVVPSGRRLRTVRRGLEGWREPTAEEVDRTVAEQMASLPPWWEESARKHEVMEMAGCPRRRGVKVYSLTKVR